MTTKKLKKMILNRITCLSEREDNCMVSCEVLAYIKVVLSVSGVSLCGW